VAGKEKTCKRKSLTAWAISFSFTGHGKETNE